MPGSFALYWLLAVMLAAACCAQESPAKLNAGIVGGANSPPPSPPPKFVIPLGELSAGSFAVRVPTGAYTAPPGGAPNYSIPGPIAAFRGPDGVWRGHGYLETYPRLLRFNSRLDAQSAELTYTFENDKSYRVKLLARDGAILIDETSDLGPRNVFVFDGYYNWLPAAGLVLNLPGTKHAFVFLPCYYDKPETTISPDDDDRPPADRPGAAVIVSSDAAKKDVAGFWCRDVAGWRNGDTMSFQLWQRRQLPGDPASRHFLGPETKSDSTPNPRTAPLLGQSLYEGHVTIELNLGSGTRELGFAVAGKGATKSSIPYAFKKVVQANQE